MNTSWSENTSPDQSGGSPLRVLFAVSEVDPLIKVGGLGDVAGSLPAALSKLPKEQTGGKRLDIRLIIPYHASIKEKIKDVKFITRFEIPTTHLPVKVQVFKTRLAELPIYLIDGKPVDALPGVYGNDPLKLAEKYIFFSRAILQFLQEQEWRMDVLHAHDWHSSLSLYGIDTLFKTNPIFRNIYKVLSIHNLPFLGEKSSEIVKKYGFPPGIDINLPDWASSLPLPLGLLAADQVIAVSPNYAREILTPEFGSGLDVFLRSHSEKITGILNGLDMDCWNPQIDREIPKRFSVDHLDDRMINKTALQQEFKLNNQISIPLMVFIGRLDYQKGFDLAIEAFTQIADLPWQVIILGTGNPALEKSCIDLEQMFPDRVRTALRFDSNLSRRLYAGADILIMPSRYEPCGLAQMIAMRYGCVPVARATGGLKDTIQDCAEKPGTGFLFERADSSSLANSLVRALGIFNDKNNWAKMQRMGMQNDFSWKKSSLEYAKIYQKSGGAA